MYIDPNTKTQKQRFVINGETMGTRFAAIFFANLNYDASQLAKDLQASVDLVDAQMSNWIPGSDVCRFNNAKCNIWVDMPEEILFVMKEAVKITQSSGGYFDISVGDIINAWGFGAHSKQPDKNLIADVDIDNRPNIITDLKIDIDLKRLKKTKPMTLDLCGIAKGFGVDELANCMMNAGITDYLVSIDGEMRASGHKPKQEMWNIAVEKPLKNSRDIAQAITLTQQAIATSGDYRHLRTYKNHEVSHTINKYNAQPKNNNIASISVISPNCMQADAWATALMAMGFEKAVKFATIHKMDVLFILHNHHDFVEFGIGRFEKQIKLAS